jgi:ferredoxin/flavodoxin
MSTRIFYLTGSGNSLAIARRLASEIGDAEIHPMAKHMDGFTVTNEERIGIITPVFGWGLPRMVKDFVAGLRIQGQPYIFAVADCGGTPGNTLRHLRRRLRRAGGRLHAGFVVQGDFSAPLPGMEIGIIKFVAWLARKSFPKPFREREQEIVGVLRAKAGHRLESNNPSANLVGSLLHGAAAGSFKKGDKDFAVSDACVSCGTCSKACPRENVRLVEDRPTWLGDCEMCYACYLSCPQKAISFKGARPTDPTRHPEVQLSDMLLR